MNRPYEHQARDLDEEMETDKTIVEVQTSSPGTWSAQLPQQQLVPSSAGTGNQPTDRVPEVAISPAKQDPSCDYDIERGLIPESDASTPGHPDSSTCVATSVSDSNERSATQRPDTVLSKVGGEPLSQEEQMSSSSLSLRERTAVALFQLESEVTEKLHEIDFPQRATQPGATCVPTLRVTEALERELIVYTSDPATDVSTALTQLETEVLEKLHSVSIIAGRATVPGAVSISSLRGEVFQLQHEIADKLREIEIPCPTRPSASVLLPSRANTGAGGTQQPAMGDQDIMVNKVNISIPHLLTSEPSTDVSIDLSQLESEVLEKVLVVNLPRASKPGVASISSVRDVAEPQDVLDHGGHSSYTSGRSGDHSFKRCQRPSVSEANSIRNAELGSLSNGMVEPEARDATKPDGESRLEHMNQLEKSGFEMRPSVRTQSSPVVNFEEIVDGKARSSADPSLCNAESILASSLLSQLFEKPPALEENHSVEQTSRGLDTVGNPSSFRENAPDPGDAPFASGIRAFTGEPVEQPLEASHVTVIADDYEDEETPVMRFVLLFVAFCVLVVPAIVLALTISNSRKSPASPPSVESPTASPLATLAPTTTDFGPVAALFEPISGREVFKDNNSPQYKAVYWLTHDDTYDSGYERNSTKYTQRYVMAVLFFACLGDEWRNCDKYTGCPPGVNNWLTATDECSWYVVTCNDDGFVTSLDFGPPKTETPRDGSGMVAIATPTRYVKGSLPSEFGALAQLEVFSVPNHKLQGSMSPFWTLNSLRSLILSGNSMTGRIPSSIEAAVPLLVTFDIGTNNVTGSIPDSVSGLFYLEELGLDGNQLTGTIPSKLGLISGLSSVDVHDNNLHGGIPLNLFNTRIETLRLGGNPLRGSIPHQISQMSQLRVLYLGDSQMSGDIPDELFHLEQLEDLYLQDANFTGKLSEDFVLLNQTLRELSLKGNDFYGDIPTGFDYCTHLEVLDLSDNPRISGAISNALCSRLSSGENKQVDKINTLKVDCAVACNCCGFRDNCMVS